MARHTAVHERAAKEVARSPEGELAQFRRPPKVLVAARLDREVYEWLKQYGEGYSTRINEILRAVMARRRWGSAWIRAE